MPRTLAHERIKLTGLTVKPTNILVPTIAELAAGIDFECRTLRSETRLSATASDTFSEPLSCEPGNPTDYGASNFEGSLTLFWWLDAQGRLIEAENDCWEAVKIKGSELWFYQRTGPKHSEAWSEDDTDVELFHVRTDNAQQPSDPYAGYIKRVIPLGIQGDSAVSGITIAAA